MLSQACKPVVVIDQTWSVYGELYPSRARKEAVRFHRRKPRLRRAVRPHGRGSVKLVPLKARSNTCSVIMDVLPRIVLSPGDRIKRRGVGGAIGFFVE